jgi:hypothetical protein
MEKEVSVKIKVQSLNDIITNSSTEIIATISDDAVDTIKNLVNELLKTCGSRYCFDSLFTIRTYWDNEDCWEDYGYSSKEEYIRDLEEHNGDLSGQSSGKSYKVTAIDPKNDKAAELLNSLQSMVDTFECYC